MPLLSLRLLTKQPNLKKFFLIVFTQSTLVVATYFDQQGRVHSYSFCIPSFLPYLMKQHLLNLKQRGVLILQCNDFK